MGTGSVQFFEDQKGDQPSGLSSSQRHQSFLEVKRDAPNLLWLYVLIVEAEIELSEGELVAAMKHRLLKEKSMSPMAWRLLANGNASDFSVVLNGVNPGGEPQWQWNQLVAWLRVLCGLCLKDHFLPEPLQQLFLNDSLCTLLESDEIMFRNAWMRFGTLRTIMNEAKRRLALGTLDRFIEEDLVPVITWLAKVDPTLDSNSLKSGWKYLARKSAAWKTEIDRHAEAESLRWRSALTGLLRDPWRVDCVTDSWALYRLALSQRHCADRYLGGCLADTDRIFTVSDVKGKIRATIRISRASDNCKWDVSDVRGFANTQVSVDLVELGREVAEIYTEQWENGSSSETFRPSDRSQAIAVTRG